MKKRLVIYGIILVVVLIGLFAIYRGYNKEVDEPSFIVDTFLLKSSVDKGSSVTNTISIVNGENDLDFNVELVGLDKAFIGKTDMSISANGEDSFNINFNADETGIFSGKVIVKADGEEMVIPVIFEVKTKEIDYAPNLNPTLTYRDLIPGEYIIAEAAIFDLKNIGKKEVEVSYVILDLNGNTIIIESEKVIVEDKTSVSKSFKLPDNIALGPYVFGVILDDDGKVSTSSFIVNVSNEQDDFFSGQMFYIWAFFVFFIIILFFIILYSIYSRDKLLLELKEQNQKEMRRMVEILGERRKVYVGKEKIPAKRAMREKEFGKIQKEMTINLKEKQKQRIKIYKKLKGKLTKEQMLKQMHKWKSEGYDIGLLKKKLKMTKKEMTKYVKKWDKQGYNVKLLKKKM
ncbi:MAG: hypothetical protein KKF56_04295 [Nanoarchaeota archaeon]|nr:hypothetical protein [Nanoarchaeota archaeon]